MKKTIQIIAGLLMLSTAIWGYYNSMEYTYQLTFISNFTAGTVLLVDGLINLFFDKRVSALVYQIVLLCTNVVFFTCIFTLFGWHSFNFSGAFFFLHIINPPIFLTMYLLFAELKIESKSDYLKRIFISPIMIMCYLIFDYIRYLITGNLVYGLIPTEILTPILAILIGIVFYFLMAFMSYGLLDLKLYIQKKSKNKS